MKRYKIQMFFMGDELIFHWGGILYAFDIDSEELGEQGLKRRFISDKSSMVELIDRMAQDYYNEDKNKFKLDFWPEAYNLEKIFETLWEVEDFSCLSTINNKVFEQLEQEFILTKEDKVKIRRLVRFLLKEEWI